MTFKLKEKKISLIWQRAWDAAHWARYYPAQQMLPEFTRAPNYQSICEAAHSHLCQHQPALGAVPQPGLGVPCHPRAVLAAAPSPHNAVFLPELEQLPHVPSAGAAQGHGECWRRGCCGPACPGTALPLPLPPPLQDEAMKLFFYLSSFQFRLRKICAPLAPPQ